MERHGEGCDGNERQKKPADKWWKFTSGKTYKCNAVVHYSNTGRWSLAFIDLHLLRTGQDYGYEMYYRLCQILLPDAPNGSIL